MKHFYITWSTFTSDSMKHFYTFTHILNSWTPEVLWKTRGSSTAHFLISYNPSFHGCRFWANVFAAWKKWEWRQPLLLLNAVTCNEYWSVKNNTLFLQMLGLYTERRKPSWVWNATMRIFQHFADENRDTCVSVNTSSHTKHSLLLCLLHSLALASAPSAPTSETGYINKWTIRASFPS